MLRAAMVADISAHRHRGHLVAPAARRELRALFRALPTRQRALERQLDEWLDRAGTDWQQRLQNLCLTVGVGTISALQLLAYLPERGAGNRRQIAKLPGLAPLPWDSGHLLGVRPIQHGRSPARRVLFQSAVVAAGWIPPVGTTSSVPTTHNFAHAVNRLKSPPSPSPANP
jgi:transposase